MVPPSLVSPTRDSSTGRWLPAVAGFGAELLALALAVAVSLPPPVARVAGLATLGVGLVGGVVVGRLSSDQAAARRNGVLAGVAGGVSTAVVVRGTMSLALSRARWSAMWAVEYAIARGVGVVLPGDVVARYDGAIATGLAVALGGVVLAGTVAAAVAVAPVDVEP